MSIIITIFSFFTIVKKYSHQPISRFKINYNSPGAADALPIAAMIVKELIEEGIKARLPKTS